MGEEEDAFAAAEARFNALADGVTPPVEAIAPEVIQEEEVPFPDVEFGSIWSYDLQSHNDLGLAALEDTTGIFEATLPAQIDGTISTLQPDGSIISLEQLAYSGYISLRVINIVGPRALIQVGIPLGTHRYQWLQTATSNVVRTLWVDTNILSQDGVLSDIATVERTHIFPPIPSVQLINDLFTSEKQRMEEQQVAAEAAVVSSDSFLKEIEEAAESVYPGNWGWITETASVGLTAHRERKLLGIHFPDITITNDEGGAHNIKDIYVAFVFDKESDNTYRLSSNMYGIRGLLTVSEWFSGYSHSHLPYGSDYRGRFANFCLGGSTATAYSLANLSDSFDVGMFELFLHQLSAYIVQQEGHILEWLG